MNRFALIAAHAKAIDPCAALLGNVERTGIGKASIPPKNLTAAIPADRLRGEIFIRPTKFVPIPVLSMGTSHDSLLSTLAIR